MLGSNDFPKLPGLAPHHDPTVTFTQKTSHKRVSATKQEFNRDYVTVYSG